MKRAVDRLRERERERERERDAFSRLGHQSKKKKKENKKEIKKKNVHAGFFNLHAGRRWLCIGGKSKITGGQELQPYRVLYYKPNARYCSFSSSPTFSTTLMIYPNWSYIDQNQNKERNNSSAHYICFESTGLDLIRINLVR